VFRATDRFQPPVGVELAQDVLDHLQHQRPVEVGQLSGASVALGDDFHDSAFSKFP